MKIRKHMALVFLGLSLSASAQFTTIIEAYEIEIGDLRLPGSIGGTISFRRCADCEFQTILVNSKTRYVLNGHDLELTEFKQRLEGVEDESATVMHHLESNRITMVKIIL